MPGIADEWRNKYFQRQGPARPWLGIRANEVRPLGSCCSCAFERLEGQGNLLCCNVVTVSRNRLCKFSENETIVGNNSPGNHSRGKPFLCREKLRSCYLSTVYEPMSIKKVCSHPIIRQMTLVHHRKSTWTSSNWTKTQKKSTSPCRNRLNQNSFEKAFEIPHRAYAQFFKTCVSIVTKCFTPTATSQDSFGCNDKITQGES